MFEGDITQQMDMLKADMDLLTAKEETYKQMESDNSQLKERIILLAKQIVELQQKI
jgi:hypothetical protein